MSKSAKHPKGARKAKRTTQLALIIPTLGKGERWAGVVLDSKSAPAAHVILMPGDIDNADWAAACGWAEKNKGALPTRQEQALLFANLKSEFGERAYWSGTPHAGDDASAWCQHFLSGDQGYDRKDYELRARAVRRVAI